jgi:hypothetical protein
MRQAYGREGLRRAAGIGHDQPASRSRGDADPRLDRVGGRTLLLDVSSGHACVMAASHAKAIVWSSRPGRCSSWRSAHRRQRRRTTPASSKHSSAA